MSKTKIELPKIYTESLWKKGGSVEEHKKYIGEPYLSWSSIETFNDKSGFNTGLPGEQEFILKYFFEDKFPDMGWGIFGQEVEGYVCEKEFEDKFSEKEKETLDKIKPLGVFQEEIVYDTGLGFIVIGYIDDHTPVEEDKEGNKFISLLRDYKTKSESSKKDLHLDKKHQIEIYTLGLQQKGIEVKNAEYCIIERLGGWDCMQGGGRESLSVGKRIWYEDYDGGRLKEKRLEKTKYLIEMTAKKVSELYKVYKKYF